ncbi:hypothetical protein [Segatella copri]|uniref:hypothetical protein n=1 Tax=Segatella copri TaxID=165179 RepID=UPI002230F4E0|nr:hypothetical protein [Segatella copri]MCW4080947.1 hypothetical protein [Segatella copri]
MAEGNRLPSLDNAPHQKTDGEFLKPTFNTFFQGKTANFIHFPTHFQAISYTFPTFDDIINQKSLSARVCRKAQHFIGTLQYF